MEIKPQELRIGNLICVDDEVASVTAIGKVSIYFTRTSGRRGSEHLTSVSGIELTPEWFKRFGFKEYQYTKEALLLSGSDTYVKTYTLGKLTICDWGDGKFILTNAFSFDLRVEIKTLHHLQNVVYALTGEELAIDKTSSHLIGTKQ